MAIILYFFLPIIELIKKKIERIMDFGKNGSKLSLIELL